MIAAFKVGFATRVLSQRVDHYEYSAAGRVPTPHLRGPTDEGERVVTFWPSTAVSTTLAHCLRSRPEPHPERTLSEMWPSGSPVLLSSGRVGLIWALRLIGLSRADTVRLFPFASHCVIEAVGRVATPSGPDYGDSATVHYHQWGYSRQLAAPCGEIVEDSVDSLYVPGTQLFYSGGRFEVWSLSKTLGTMGGGVLWCRDQRDAERVKELLGRPSSHPNVRWLLRAISNSGRTSMVSESWAAAESASDGGPSSLLISEVQSRLRAWAELVEARKLRLEQAMNGGANLLEHPAQMGRVPCILPVVTDVGRIRELANLGLPSEKRHFMDRHGRMTPVYPLPIHQGVSDAKFASMLEILAE